MCFGIDARPPDLPAGLGLPPTAGSARAELASLSSDDGTRFSVAFAAAPKPADGPALVILPDVRGLHGFYIALAEQFAQAGHNAIVIDYFGRTAGLGPRDDEFDFMTHTLQTEVVQIQADIAAAAAFLRERAGTTSVVTVGFCFGGSQSFLAASNDDLGLAGVVGFYGRLEGSPLGIPSVIDRTARMRGPVLALFGGADPSIPLDQIEAFGAGLERAGVEHDIVVYPGAPHSFFDRSFREHADACDAAWRSVLQFLSERGARV